MKTVKLVVLGIMISLFASSAALAADFGWFQELNAKAKADLSGFQAQLAARFRIGNTEVSAVISKVAQPADAYMVLKLGEMANQPPDRVMTQYQASRNQGWGALAKSLGIKPGSPEFHALKRGHDLYGDSGSGKGKGKGKKRK
ncbi:MAG TPA: hypothetical protein VN604_08715 [Nitrospirota bacterium]|nr:hypothetical protein [Nitrospirota bacterium]